MGSFSSPLPHIAIFPFMSKGHTIPLICLARLLHRRRLAKLTFFTTPLNAPFIRRSLAGIEASVIELPFSRNVPDLPPEVESTDHLPSMDLLLPFIKAVNLLRPHFERAIEQSPVAVDLLISDGFLGWTNNIAMKFSMPRLVFYGMNSFAMTVAAMVSTYKPHAGVSSPYEPFMVPGFPDLWITKADLEAPFDDPEPSGPHFEFVIEQVLATRASRGIIVNSFYELEAPYVELWSSQIGPKAWCVGPLTVAREPSERAESLGLMQWLDLRFAKGRPVLYVAFGSQAKVSPEQLGEIAAGLERSGLDFLWVVRDSSLPDRFEDRVQEKGLVVRQWVDQPEILGHEAVKGFMSHCGWNSVMESVVAGVPILAWPMMAEQRLNAKFVVEELKVGLRIRASDGTRDGLVKAEDIEKLVKELLIGEKGEEAKEKAKDLAIVARKAMDEDGGSSWLTLEKMISELCKEKKEKEKRY